MFGCSGAVDGPSSGTAKAEKVASSSAALGTGVYTYVWSQGQGPVTMKPVGQSMCVLTAVKGAFRGGGEYVSVDDVNGNWTLEGRSQQSGVLARATCVDFTLFWNGGTSGINYSIGDYNVSFTSPHGSNGYNEEILMWGSDSACWINGAGGLLNTMNNYVNIQGEPLQNNANSLWLKTGEVAYMQGASACESFFGLSAPKYVGNSQYWTNYDSLKGVQKPLNVNINTGGICYLTEVGGDYATSLDSISIGIDGYGNQYLYGYAQNIGPNYPNLAESPVAYAACLSYAQHN
jgi:hypothetical protein